MTGLITSTTVRWVAHARAATTASLREKDRWIVTKQREREIEREREREM